MLTSQRRTATAFADTDCILFFMTTSAFDAVIRDFPMYYDQILNKAMERRYNPSHNPNPNPNPDPTPIEYPNTKLWPYPYPGDGAAREDLALERLSRGTRASGCTYGCTPPPGA